MLLSAHREAICNCLIKTSSGINSECHLKIRAKPWDFRFPKSPEIHVWRLNTLFYQSSNTLVLSFVRNDLNIILCQKKKKNKHKKNLPSSIFCKAIGPVKAQANYGVMECQWRATCSCHSPGGRKAARSGLCRPIGEAEVPSQVCKMRLKRQKENGRHFRWDATRPKLKSTRIVLGSRIYWTLLIQKITVCPLRWTRVKVERLL